MAQQFVHELDIHVLWLQKVTFHQTLRTWGRGGAPQRYCGARDLVSNPIIYTQVYKNNLLLVSSVVHTMYTCAVQSLDRRQGS